MRLIEQKDNMKTVQLIVFIAALFAGTALLCGLQNNSFSGGVYSATGFEAERVTRFVIIDHGKYGFIDSTGQVVIPVEYSYAGAFSEGLAPVRKNGLYGYIDENGTQRISEQFDYAEEFHNGHARVYIKGIPYIINRKGEILFKHGYTSIGDFANDSLASATLADGRVCLIDLKGNKVASPVFSEIGEFHSGRAVAIRFTSSKSWRDRVTGVIDRSGHFVVPFGKYDGVQKYSDDLAIARYNEKQPGSEKYVTKYHVLDTNGKVQLEIPYQQWRPHDSETGYNEGLLVVDVYKVNPDSLKSWVINNTYPGVVDRKGNVVFSSKQFEEISHFSHGRAFAKLENSGSWIMINTEGKQIGSKEFTDVCGVRYRTESDRDFFEDGKALVRDEQTWKFIDTTGKEIRRHPYVRYPEYRVRREGNIVVMGEEICQIWVPGDTLLFRQYFKYVVPGTLNDALIQVVFIDKETEETTWGYINRSGKTVWKFSNAKENFSHELNIDYMNRGYFMASSPFDEDLNGVGGWGQYDNLFKPLSDFRSNFSKDKLQAIIDTNKSSSWFDICSGYEIYLINSTDHKYYFPSENSRINMLIQAQDSEGNWKDIEYLPHSFCGNSYLTLFLPQNSYWTFVMPVYQGIIPTKLRAKVEYESMLNQKSPQILYSNEINGSVNPAQFWRKREYFPSGIMDSYTE